MAFVTRAIWACLLCTASVGLCQEKEKENPAELTLDRIFSSSELRGDSLGSFQWLKKTGGYVTLEDSETQKGSQDIVHHSPESGKTEVLVSASHLIPGGETSPLKIESFRFSPNEGMVLIFTNSKRVWRQNTRGDYWLFDITSRELTQLGGEDAKASTLMFAKFAPNSRKVAYVRERNIYVEDLKSHSIFPVTQTASKDIINGTFDWVYEEELGLRDGFRWSPDSEHIAYWQMDTKGVGIFYMIDNTKGLYPRLIPIQYPKVGTKNSSSQIGVTRAQPKASTHWLTLGPEPRNNYLARMEWISQDELVIQRLNRLQNTNTIYLVDIEPPKAGDPFNEEIGSGPKTMLVEKDPAWVDVHDHLQYLESQKGFLWLSERDGWRHLYLVSKDGKTVKLITPGKLDVFDSMVHVDEKGGQVYFYASPENATQQYLHRASLDGEKVERVTPENSSGWNSYNISPGSKWAVHTHSAFDSPPVVNLIELPSHKVVRSLVDNKELLEKVKALNRGTSEFLKVEIGNGIALDTWSMKPPKFAEGKKYPLLFYVYGEPAGQTVLDRWSGTRYLWHLMLTQMGYVVMSVDNRGTPAPKGRAWRKAAYRQVGILAAEEQAKAARAILKKSPWIDSERVGIWGWSGGGSMSLHAIFRFPELYHMAMSIAPVSNERLYDTIYQERYMGLPEDNVKGYRNGSPITYAKGLKGKLLLVHGTEDDNVHYQNAEVLVNELIRHGKQFDMFSYPNRTHSIREGKGTRRHLFGLLTRYLNQHLPTKPE